MSMSKRYRALVIATVLGITAIAYAVAVPSVGLYWKVAVDPTVAPGVVAPLNQLLIRTDAPAIYYKSGNAATAWTQIGVSGSHVLGTVNKIPKFTAVDTIGNSSVSDDGTTVSTAEPISIAGETNSSYFRLSGVITPTAFTGVQVDNYNPASLATVAVIQASATVATTVTGLTAQPTGTIIDIRNIATSLATITLSNQNAASLAANQFALPGTADWVIPVGSSIQVRYTGATWRLYALGTTRFPTIAVDGQTTVASLVETVAHPTGVTGTLDDYAPTGIGTATVLLPTTSGATTLDGIVGGVDGRRLTLFNDPASLNTIVVASNAGGSTAANRIATIGAVSWNVGPGMSMELVYSSVNSRWNQDGTTRLAALTVDGTTSTSSLQVNGRLTLASDWAITAVISPTAISGSTNDYAPTNHATNVVYRQGITTAATLTGLIAETNGAIRIITNIETTAGLTLTLTNEDVLSSATNRFTLQSGLPITINPGGSFTIRYDGTSSRWRPANQTSAPLLATQSDTSTGTVDNFVLTGGSSQILRLVPASTVTFDGFKCGVNDCTAADSGKQLHIILAPGANISAVLANDAAGSVAGNRIYTQSNSNITLAPNNAGASANAGAILEYDGASLRWRVLSFSSSTISQATTYTASLTAASTMTVGDFRGTVQSDTSTGTVNDFSTTSTTTTIRWAGASSATFTGMTGGAAGRRVRIINASAGQTINFSNEAGGSTAANRFNLFAATTQSINSVANGAGYIEFEWDTTLSRWLQAGFTQSTQFNQGMTFAGTVSAFNISNAGGHERATGAALTITSCGGSPTCTQNCTDHAGRIVSGTVNTGCTVTFANTYTTIPSCVSSCESVLAQCTCVPSATALVCTLSANSSTVIDYVCIGGA